MCARQRLGTAVVTTALLLGLSAQAPAASDPAQVDVAGGSDHPLVQRFTGSWLVGYKSNDWEQAQFPTGMGVKDYKWLESVNVEGRLTKAIYVAPPGKSPLEVFRNHEQALVGAGFQRRFSCESQCLPLYFGMRRNDSYAAGMQWAKGSVVNPGGSRYGLDAGVVSNAQGRFWYGTLPRGGQEVHVLVYTAAASNETTSALAASYRIDAKRLAGRGVGSLAPLASNAADAGRAKNRRVELVLQ